MAIKIDTNALTGKINELKEQQRIIAEVLEKFKGDTLIMDTYWSGNTGDRVKERLTKYMTVFDIINKKIFEYISFLEAVVNGYVDEENMIMNQIEIDSNIPIGPSGSIASVNDSYNINDASTLTDATDNGFKPASDNGVYMTDVPSIDSNEDFEGKLNSLLENGWIVETRPPYLMQVDENGNLTHYSPNDYLLNDIGSVHEDFGVTIPPQNQSALADQLANQLTGGIVHEDFGVTLPPQLHEVPHQEVTIPAPNLGYHHGPQVAPNGIIYYEKSK